MVRALLVDADVEWSRQILPALQHERFAVDHLCCLNEATAAIETVNYDLVLMERKFSDGDSIDWIRRYRSSGRTIPLLIVTGQPGPCGERVSGLDAGADDYVVKPTPVDEILARIRAVMRRPANVLDSVLKLGNVEYDLVGRELWVAGTRIRMPRRETCLFELLIRRAGRTMMKAALEEGLYSFEEEVSSNAIEVGIYRLRGHLMGAGATVVIRTVRGMGYVIEAGAPTAAADGMPAKRRKAPCLPANPPV